MSDFWIKAAQLILSLSILIVLHEMGHMIPAKLFKTRVEKFYLFFNPSFSLFRFKKVKGVRKTSWFSSKSPKSWEEDKDTTEYGIGWLPLGGFVKISGMIDESMDKEQMAKPAEDWEFRSKKAWQRLIIMIGGVVVNLILGFLIYMMVLGVWGRDYVKHDDVSHGFSVLPIMEKQGFQDGDHIVSVNGDTLFNVLDITKHMLVRDVQTVEVVHPGETAISVIDIPEDIGMQMWTSGQEQAFTPIAFAVLDSVIEGGAARKAGFLKGDSLVSINGEPTMYMHEAYEALKSDGEEEYSISLYRDNQLQAIEVKSDTAGKIGINFKSSKLSTVKVSHMDYSFGEAVANGWDYGYWTLHDYVVQFKYIFTSKGAGEIGGFGAIGNMFPSEWDWHQFWLNTAFISIILAFMNLLPIPALDGGHVMFLLWEMLTGRAVGQKTLERAQMIGMILLLGLLVYANGNDILKWITG